MAQTIWQPVVYAKGIMKSRSTYNLKIDTISTYDIPLDRSFLKLWNGIRYVMPSTDRRLELKEKTSMAQNAWQASVYENGLMIRVISGTLQHTLAHRRQYFQGPRKLLLQNGVTCTPICMAWHLKKTLESSISTTVTTSYLAWTLQPQPHSSSNWKPQSHLSCSIGKLLTEWQGDSNRQWGQPDSQQLPEMGKLWWVSR